MTRRLLMMLVVAGAAGLPAVAAAVSERWGAAGPVQHAGALKFESAGKDGGTMMSLDLSALPKDTKVYLARLFFAGGGGASGYDIVPATRSGEGGQPAVDGKPLALVAPWFTWFDATEPVRKWAEAGQKTGDFWLRKAPQFKQEATYLEITYEGQAKDLPKQVSDVKAVHRAGQVFITFKEIDPPDGGKAEATVGEVGKKVRFGFYGVIPDDSRQQLRYYVFAHDKPITAETVGQAELLAEVVPGSALNTRFGSLEANKALSPRTIEGGHGAIDNVVMLRLAAEPGKPVPPGCGLYVHTVAREGKFHYAVATAVNGVVNLTDLSAANVVGPVEQRPATPEPVLYREFVTDLRGATYRQQFYSCWTVQPLSPWPARYDVVVGLCPDILAKPAPLEITRGHAWGSHPESPGPHRTTGINVALTADDPNEFFTGMPDWVGTLKGIEQGKWQPFTPNRQYAILDWLRKTWQIDPQRITNGIGAWGCQELRRGDLFSMVHGWVQPEQTKGWQSWQRVVGVWGPPKTYEGRPDDENPYVYSNMTDWVLASPTRELPYVWVHTGWGAHFTEMGWPGHPKFFAAMMKTKRAFCYSPRGTPVAEAIGRGAIGLLRDQSLPAFAHCTLDDNVGEGELSGGDGWQWAQINGFVLWDTGNIVDEPGNWQMTMWVDASAAYPNCTVDLTPRRCQKFRAKPGASFVWTNTLIEEPPATVPVRPPAGRPGSPNAVVRVWGPLIQSGKATADAWGLVTVEKLGLTKGRHRIEIKPE